LPKAEFAIMIVQGFAQFGAGPLEPFEEPGLGVEVP
jgi:hypothetical protein